MVSTEAYLAELASRLQGRLSPEIVEARLREVRAHLAMEVAETDETTALRRFGTPAATARAIVRQARGYDARSAASLAWVPGLVLLLALIGERVWSALMPIRFTYSGGVWSPVEPTEAVFRLGLWIPFLGMVLFAGCCLRTRRWLVVPVAAWATVGLVLVGVATWALAPNVAPPDAVKRIASYRDQLAMPSQDEREVGFWREGQPSTWSIPVTEHMPNFVTVPGIPMLFTREITTYNVRLFHGSKEAARREWDANGEGWARTVAARRQGLRNELAALEAGRAYLSPPWTLWVGYFLLRIALMSVVLFAFNAFALLLGGVVDRLPPRRRIAGR